MFCLSSEKLLLWVHTTRRFILFRNVKNCNSLLMKEITRKRISRDVVVLLYYIITRVSWGLMVMVIGAPPPSPRPFEQLFKGLMTTFPRYFHEPTHDT
jgi:hypothetical protein